MELDIEEELFCPVCKAAICGPNLDGFCDHVLFYWSGEAGDFEYVAAHLKPAADKAMVQCTAESDDGDLSPSDLLLQGLPPDSVLCLELSIRSLACGPICTADVIVLNLSTKASQS